MVLAARVCGIPAALTEADAHLGLANRLAAPFASKLFLAYEIPGLGRQEGARSSGGRSRSPISVSVAPRRGRGSVSARTSRRWPSSGRSRERTSLNEMAVAAWGDVARPCCTSRASATSPPSRPRVASRRLPADVADRALRRCPRGGRRRSLPRRGDGLGARRGGDTGDSRPLPARHRRPSDAQRAALRAGRGSGRRARTPRSSACRALVAELLADPERLEAMRERDARDGARRCGGPDRRRGDRTCRGEPDARLWRGDGSTSSGSAARACPPTRTSPAPSAPRCGAGMSATRSSSARSRGSRSTSGASLCRPPAGRRSSRPHTCIGSRAFRRADVPRGARRGAARDRRRRSPRQDDDGRDDRLRARADRPRSGLDHRRHRPAARGQRRSRLRAGSSSRATSPIARSGRSRPRSR